MNKTVLKYGLISGACAAVLMILTAFRIKDSNGFEHGEIYGYTGILLSMIFVFLGVKAYRDKNLDGRISFGKAFQVGILITVISCICYVLAWMFVYQTIIPDFMDKYVAHMLEQMRQSGATPEQISQETQKMESFKTMYQNPFVRFGMTFLEPFPVGLLVTLISAAILRKQNV